MMAEEPTPALEAAMMLGNAERELREAMARDPWIENATEKAIAAYIKAVDHYVEVTSDA